MKCLMLKWVWPMCKHAAELCKALDGPTLLADREVMVGVSDGGPDHNLKFFFVQASLVLVFLKKDLDMLGFSQTAYHQSWRNPVERCMHTVNLGLQTVALARGSMDNLEKHVKPFNTMSQVRAKLQAVGESL